LPLGFMVAVASNLGDPSLKIAAWVPHGDSLVVSIKLCFVPFKIRIQL